ncbi:MAG: carbohydrate-binding domain-containing protein [Bergeyella sp.]
MKKYLLILGVLFSFLMNAQYNIVVNNSGNTMYASPISSVDQITFDGTYSKILTSGNTSTLNIQKAFIDSFTFTTSTVNLDKIYIIWNGTDDATIINPYSASGVTITATGGAVTVTSTSTTSNLEYNLLGTSSAGSLTMSSVSPASFVLNNLNLTNASGPAIIVTGAQTHTFTLQSGTTNSLTDGASSSKNGALQTDGNIVFAGTGSLSINGIKKHGISTSKAIEIQNGTITVTGAASDGLHSEGFTMSSGTLTVTATGDAVDAGDTAVAISGGSITANLASADVKGIKTGTNTINISGGTINLTLTGAQSKAISAKQAITITGGTITANLSGAAVLTASGSGFDPSYSTAIKSDTTVNISNATINLTLTSTANGGKGIAADEAITINSGNITISTAGSGAAYTNTDGLADSYSSSSISSDTDINILGGTLVLTNSGTASKGINADGNVTVSGGSTTVNLSGATLLAASGSGYDPSYPTGIKADGTVTISAGTVTVTGTSAATGTKGISADGDINISAGTVNITTAGNGATYTNASGTIDSYSSAAISGDANVVISGGSVTTSSSGSAGKGIKSDGQITIGTTTSSPTLNITTTGARLLVSGTDYSHPKTMVAAGAIVINNGTNTLNSTDDGIHSDTSITINGGTNKISAVSATSGVGEGIEAPIINLTGGTNTVNASNDGINATYGTVSGGTEADDGSQLNISGGIHIITGSDAVDSNGDITITGGTTIINGPTSQPEEGIDFNGTFNMNGGFLISAGSNASMTKAMSTTSTQVGMYIKSNAQLPTTSMIHIRNTAGTEMVTFKPKNAVYYFHFSSPNLAKSTQYRIYFGGSYTGGSYVGGTSGWGLYTGGTYSTTGATLKSTTTTSSSSTVNTISF